MTPTCQYCGANAGRSKKAMCQPCYHARRRKPDRDCIDCAKPISRYTKSGLCAGCKNRRNGRDPEFQRRRAEGIRRKFAEDPAHREKMRKLALRACQKAMCDPEYVARLRERGKILVRTVLCTPEALAKLAAVRGDNGRKASETRLGWCPPEWRARYKQLTISRRMLAADARAHVEREVERARLARAAATGISDAIRFLRRFAPVIAREDGYLYGTTVLSAEQIIERAEFRGWQPERFAA